MLIYNSLFYVFALLLVLSALSVVSVKNSVYSVLFLIFAFFNAAGIFVMLGAEFLALSLVIVYVGAVAVLFLFVVMTVNIKEIDLKIYVNQNYKSLLLVCILLVSELIACVVLSVSSNFKITLSQNNFLINGAQTNTEQIALVLYTNYAALFQICGLILLAAIIGAISLTHRESKNLKRQDLTKQLERNKENSIKLMNIKKGEGVNAISNF